MSGRRTSRIVRPSITVLTFGWWGREGGRAPWWMTRTGTSGATSRIVSRIRPRLGPRLGRSDAISMTRSDEDRWARR